MACLSRTGRVTLTRSWGIQAFQYSSQANLSRRVAFAFDIDGVLKAGPKVLPEAIRTMAILNGNNPLNTQVPYIFITNGGGSSESSRAQELSDNLQVEISPNHIVQAHTVFRSLAEEFGSKNVLAIGGANTDLSPVRETMHSYGFKKVYIPKDITAWNKSVWPFGPAMKNSETEKHLIEDFSKVPFDAVLVFHDSRDWGRDIQLICDVLRSPDGIIGNVGNDTHPQPFLAFSHGDLQWGTDFTAPRFGQGAFQHAVRAVYEATSGRKLESITFGKPEKLTYEYADKLIKKRASEIYGRNDNLSMWMIGDNPASDIAGANAFGWSSALLNTGVYRGKKYGPPAFKPTIFSQNVEQAIRQILSKEWNISM